MKKKISNNPAGRPRSAMLTQEVHAAVFSLLEEGSYQELSIDAIAAKAEISRPALYRRYASVGQTVLAALVAKGPAILPMPATEDVVLDLQRYFNAFVNAIREDSSVGKALRGTLSTALVDSSLQSDFRRFIAARRQPVLDRLHAWDASLSEEALESMADALFGPILYRLMVRQVPVKAKNIQEIVARALGARSLGSTGSQ